ncbi:unnamed protein product, partial [Mesorhabditis spiculigera]
MPKSTRTSGHAFVNEDSFIEEYDGPLEELVPLTEMEYASTSYSFPSSSNGISSTIHHGVGDFEDGRSADYRAVRKVFIEEDDTGMHFDWPIYSKEQLGVARVACILQQISNENPALICDSIPHEFTGSGGFVVKFQAPELSFVDDSLGEWNCVSETECHFTKNAAGKMVQTRGRPSNLKVKCTEYLHPGTDFRLGKFTKKIYTGESNTPEMLKCIVITYEWTGTPHPLAVEYEAAEPFEESVDDLATCQPDGRHVPKDVVQPLNFDGICKIFLGCFHIAEGRICAAAPADYRQQGTFIVDKTRLGAAYLSRDKLKWTKPSGTSRFFQFKNDVAVRVEPGARPETRAYDVKIFCKRYDSEEAGLKGFVRKIYTCTGPEHDEKCNSHLAVIVYSWKQQESAAANEKPATTSATPIKKRRLDNAVDVERLTTPDFSAENGPEEGELRRKILQKSLENQNRMGELLDRAERVLERFEKMSQKGGVKDQS